MWPGTRTRLEVIVTTLAEAQEAEAGGADCLEIVSELRLGGLTPPVAEVKQILAAVSIPSRVMLRPTAASEINDVIEMEQLVRDAEALGALPIDGLVLGFVKNGEVDVEVLRQIAGAAPNLPFTFHRAFEELSDPFAGIHALKDFGQVDRILVSIADSERGFKLADLQGWQAAAGSTIRFIAGIGLSWELLSEVTAIPALQYVHVGRFAREQHSTDGLVSRSQVARLKSALA